MKSSTDTNFDGLETIDRKPRLADKVAESILETIRSEGLEPGTSLPAERELGEQFGVSRTVIREAIRSLSSKGLVRVVSGSGVKVVAVDVSTVRESMVNFVYGSDFDYDQLDEVRQAIELAVAGHAAERATPDDVARIARSVEAMAHSLGDLEACVEADLAFHRALALATHNELFVALNDSIGEALVEVRRRKLAQNVAQRRQCSAAHRAILGATAAHDALAAREAMSAHLRELSAEYKTQ
jgi:GntR family transcriptional regulator, transcriptional repressor for pyruvate dehydrogenase complex